MMFKHLLSKEAKQVVCEMRDLGYELDMRASITFAGSFDVFIWNNDRPIHVAWSQTGDTPEEIFWRVYEDWLYRKAAIPCV